MSDFKSFDSTLTEYILSIPDGGVQRMRNSFVRQTLPSG